MAVPSRVYVGVVTFGLIVVLPILAYASLLLAGYAPPPTAPHEILFPEEPVRNPAEIVFLVIAILFSVAFTVFAARALLEGARRDERKRKAVETLRRDLKRARRDRQNRLRPPN